MLRNINWVTIIFVMQNLSKYLNDSTFKFEQPKNSNLIAYKFGEPISEALIGKNGLNSTYWKF